MTSIEIGREAGSVDFGLEDFLAVEVLKMTCVTVDEIADVVSNCSLFVGHGLVNPHVTSLGGICAPIMSGCFMLAAKPDSGPGMLFMGFF